MAQGLARCMVIACTGMDMVPSGIELLAPPPDWGAHELDEPEYVKLSRDRWQAAARASLQPPGAQPPPPPPTEPKEETDLASPPPPPPVGESMRLIPLTPVVRQSAGRTGASTVAPPPEPVAPPPEPIAPVVWGRLPRVEVPRSELGVAPPQPYQSFSEPVQSSPPDTAPGKGLRFATAHVLFRVVCERKACVSLCKREKCFFSLAA